MQTSDSNAVLSWPHTEMPTNDYIASVVVGLAITTNRATQLPSSPIGITTPFFNSLMPSFCQTASQGYNYRFYLAYDAQDEHFKQNVFRITFASAFEDYVASYCPQNSSYSITLVRCDYMGKPAWAQNDAMIEAYLDNADYYYRVNDDSVMQTPGWTETFIDTLAKGEYPNVGVVGPSHSGGSKTILTYDFVHKTHLEVFGFYYPRLFWAWFADSWITELYKPNMSTKVESVKLYHTQEHGQRYRSAGGKLGKSIPPMLKVDRATLQR